MAILTPAQNPRGLARIIFTSRGPPLNAGYPNKKGSNSPSTALGEQKQKRHSIRSGAFVESLRLGRNKPLLVELDFLDLDDLLAILFGDRAHDGAVLCLLADFLVILFAGIFVKFVDRVFYLDDGLAL